jgi:hypothetical protein
VTVGTPRIESDELVSYGAATWEKASQQGRKNGQSSGVEAFEIYHR